jgi:hypothetical protein
MDIGHTINGTPIHIPDHDRDRHVYVAGQTGTGKSTMLENMAAQDIAAGECVVFIDPHGVSSEMLVRHIPARREFDLIYLHPARLASPISINILADLAPDDRAGRAGDVVAAFVDFFGEQAVGDRSQQVLRNALLALMNTDGTTLLSILPLLSNAEYREKILAKVTDPLVRFYWEKVFDAYSDHDRAIVISPILNKLDALFSYPAIRHTLGQAKSTVNLDEVFDRKQILIVNLAGLADGADSVFGAILVSLIWSNMRKRAGRSRVRMYLDEFARVATRSIAVILSEARKMKLELTMAHQYWGQVTEEIQQAVFGNVGTLSSLRIGPDDAPTIARYFDLTEIMVRDLPNHVGYIRYTPPSAAVRFYTEPPIEPIRASADPIIANSINHFGKPRKEAEKGVSDLFAG